MEIVIDNQIAKKLRTDIEKKITDLLADPNNRLIFRWPSLLEYLGLESLFISFSGFDESNPLFQATVATLHKPQEKETVLHIYDRLFAEVLTQIKELKQIQPNSLLEAIENSPKHHIKEIEDAISKVLNDFKKLLSEKGYSVTHDLILYLAWDRMCVWLSYLFDYQSKDANFITALKVLQECLVESYVHISRQGQIIPSFYRLSESLIFYYMREESLDSHTPEEWETLSQSFQFLVGKDKIADCYYIDEAISILEGGASIEPHYLTLDSYDQIHMRLLVANVILGKLKAEFVDWDYVLNKKNIISIF